MDEFGKQNGPNRPIKVIDLAILLYHVSKGAADKEIGFEDCLETFETLSRKLNKLVYLDPTVLETALWSANMMDEQGKFWHPSLTFEQWAKSLVGSDTYNRRYCTIDKKDG